jgi:hypothetical protein
MTDKRGGNTMSMKRVLMRAARTQKQKREIEKMTEAEAVNLLRRLSNKKEEK